MIRKEAQFNQATELRKRGFSYKEIAKIVNVSKSTVSLWLGKNVWSAKIRDDNVLRAAKENSKRISLLNKARSNQFKKLYAEAERSALIEYKHYRTNPLFVAGLMLYMNSGDIEHERLIRLTTSKMHTHRIFLSFAKDFLGVPREKVRFWTLLYPEHEPKAVLQAWAKTLRLSPAQFHKYQVIQGKSSKKALRYGVGNTIIGSAVLKKKLMKWIELVLKDL